MHGMDGRGGRAGLAGVPSDYRLVTLANSPVRANQPKIYEMLDKYTATFERQFDEDSKRIKSLYLWSESPGTGKTTTAVALLNAWLVAHYIGSLKRGRQPLQQPAYFLDVNEFQTRYNLATMTDDDAELSTIRELIGMCQRIPFLVMDDIGVRGASEAFRAYLHAIINYRVANGLPTVYTSNIPIHSDVEPEKRVKEKKPYDIRDVFDDRLYDRIRDQCAVLHFEGESKRGIRKN